MELDARQLAGSGGLGGDVCIVGAGPAGQSLALALAATGRTIIVMESGNRSTPPELELLNHGPTTGIPYAGIGVTRCRGIGGTARQWNTMMDGMTGAKLVPLDPVDFERTEWPFGPEELDPWYQSAHRLLGLGPFRYEAEGWARPEQELLHLPSDDVATRVYQLGPAAVFTGDLPGRLALAPNVILCHSGTVGKLYLDSRRRRVLGLEVRGWPSGTARVVAESYVLAAGAIENARLLLLQGSDEHAPGNHAGWLGRCFMEHPRDRSLSLRLHRSIIPDAALPFYDFHQAATGFQICGRVALAAEAIRRDNIPNASATLFPRRPGWLGHLTPSRRPRGHGWSRLPGAANASWWSILINLEQVPHPENRIELTRERDAFGLPRVALRWSWHPEEQAALERLRGTMARALAPLGRIEVRSRVEPDFNAHHHAGTTRMHRDSARGVVDGNGRVHEMENLFVTGSSMLPSAGFANPVLTVVALSLRLAHHLGGDRAVL